MKTIKYLAVGVFSYLQCLPLAIAEDNPMFDNERCPWYYLRQNYHESFKDFNMEFIATCSTSSSPKTYRTSVLMLDDCFVNENGALKLANDPNHPDARSFLDTCQGCGLMNIGPHDLTPDVSKPIIVCVCEPERPQNDFWPQASFEFDQGIWVNQDGIIGCMGHGAVPLPYSNSSRPSMIPPDLAQLPSTRTTTITSTEIRNSTVVSTATVTNNTTLTSAEITTLISTAQASCPTQSRATATVTVTKKGKKGKNKTETVTATVITPLSTTTQILTLLATLESARTGSIVAAITTETTARAALTTLYPPSKSAGDEGSSSKSDS
ncbi:hypothetical protein F5Y11DRAFT_317732 [Daldinia sp. FL1419]|nr:hypothetical protein F5Y11DRAFT_317732 [Daldinia sp. FL1419]